MANLIQATVYQIDGAPLSSPITVDFRTSDIVVREASINIAAVNSAIQYYNVPNNALSVKTYYVSDTIAQLVSDANEGLITQVQVTVLEINNDPVVDGGIQYSFPSNEILVGEVLGSPTGINSTITFKNDVYSVAETQATILAAVNDLSQFILNEGGVPSFQANTLANLPLPGNAGKMFISTDTYAFYRDNGLGWDLIGGPGIGTVTGSGVATQVAFWNGTSVISGSSNLFWDGVNARLGIGTSSPAQQLDLTGSARIQTIANATTDTDRFLVSDAGVIKYRTGAEVLSDIGAPAGTGTTNYLVKWTGTTALGNSLVFDDGTNVGIGTTSPTSKLHINGGTLNVIGSGTSVNEFRSNGIIAIDMTPNLSDDYKFRTLVAVSGDVTQTAINNISINSGGFFGFGGGGSEKMRLTSAGRLLIGTSTESTFLLDVSGTFRSTGNATLGTNLSLNSTIPGTLSNNFAYAFLANAGILQADLSTNTAFLIGSNGYWNGTNTVRKYNGYISSLYFNNTGDVEFQFAGTSTAGSTASTATNMIIKNSGNVGIGTTSPTNMLMVKKDQNANTSLIVENSTSNTASQASITLSSNTTGYLAKYSSGTSSSGFLSANALYLYNIGGGDIALNNAVSTGRILFGTGGSSTSQMTLFSNGNLGVGVGTTDAGYKLDVNGTARVSGNAQIGTATQPTTWSGYNALFFGASGNIYGVTNSNDAGFQSNAMFDGSVLRRIRTGFAGGLGFDNNGGFSLDLVNYAVGNAVITTADTRAIFRAQYSSGLVINEFGNSDLDVRIEGDTNANLFFTDASADNIGMGTNTPNASALLDVSSTTRGFLPPRMTNAQMVAITTPVSGLMVYDTTNNKLNVYDGTNWVAVH